MFIDDINEARLGDDEIGDKTYDHETIISADCCGIDFQSVTFEGCRFIECDLGKVSFYGCRFLRCDLSNCKLSDSYWKDCTIENSKGKGAVLTGSTFKHTALSLNSFDYAMFSESAFMDCKLTGCALSNALFSQVLLKRMVFKDCRFTKAELFRTMLKGVDLFDCDISGIALSDTFSELRGAVVSYDQAAELALLLGVKIK